MSSNKVVRVSYTTDDVFYIPKNINLEDKTQVKSWGVKYNTLFIYLTNGKKLEISNRGWIDSSCDYKYPSKTEILDAEEVGIDDDDDEDFEEVNLE
jgi:ribosome assembly protein YihI (activator of Der GTPase)